jgi:hypothetical protein
VICTFFRAKHTHDPLCLYSDMGLTGRSLGANYEKDELRRALKTVFKSIQSAIDNSTSTTRLKGIIFTGSSGNT